MNQREIIIKIAIHHEGDWEKIYQTLQNKDYEEILCQDLPKMDYKAVTILDEDYPDYLRETFRPPFVLFYYGDISLLKDPKKNLAVIGSRAITEYGFNVTKEIVEELAKEVNVVSGLARGIDYIAHSSAINSGGKTIAILGSGIDYCYPPENIDLYNEIKKNHLLISEYPGMTSPTPDKFPIRNRLIATIADTVLITEAYRRSGTSITASFALQFNKNICCVPYPYYRNSFCNHLIGEGAFLVQNANDVLEIMGIKKEEPIFEI